MNQNPIFRPDHSIGTRRLIVEVQVDEERYPLNFTETFLLMPDGAGGLFVQNHIFRLI